VHVHDPEEVSPVRELTYLVLVDGILKRSTDLLDLLYREIRFTQRREEVEGWIDLDHLV
jgi:hypothetical protein